MRDGLLKRSHALIAPADAQQRVEHLETSCRCDEGVLTAESSVGNDEGRVEWSDEDVVLVVFVEVGGLLAVLIGVEGGAAVHLVVSVDVGRLLHAKILVFTAVRGLLAARVLVDFVAVVCRGAALNRMVFWVVTVFGRGRVALELEVLFAVINRRSLAGVGEGSEVPRRVLLYEVRALRWRIISMALALAR